MIDPHEKESGPARLQSLNGHNGRRLPSTLNAGSWMSNRRLRAHSGPLGDIRVQQFFVPKSWLPVTLRSKSRN